MSLNRTGQKTNEEILTPKRQDWQVQTRNQFKLTITIQRPNMTDMDIMKYQKRIELLTGEVFESGTFKFEPQ